MAATPEADGGRPTRKGRRVLLQELIAAGLIRTPFELHKTYRGTDLHARVEETGRVACLGTLHDSLSEAASTARRSVLKRSSDSYLPTNGWIFWEYRADDGAPRKMDVLRQTYLASLQG